MKNGYIQVYTGNGKGKTTASFGLAMRAAGRNLKTHIIQFMKHDNTCGEVICINKFLPNVTIEHFGGKSFVDKKNPHPDDIKHAKDGLRRALKIMNHGDIDILILDEANIAMDFGLIDVSEVIEILDKKPQGMEVILTGRNAPKSIIERADLVTEMKEIKHYYEKNVPAREGIEM